MFRIRSPKLKFGFYRRPQQYRFRYAVGVGNPTPQDAPVAVVCPLPPDTEYQTVSHLTFQPHVSGTGRDRRHGNAYAWWDVEVPSGGGVTLALGATVGVAPRQGGIKRYEPQGKPWTQFRQQAAFNLTNLSTEAMAKVDDSSPVVRLRRTKGESKWTGSASLDACLNGDRYIIINDEIRHFARTAAAGETDRPRVVRRCYDEVVARLRYGQPITGLYTSAQAWQLPAVDCGGYATLLAAMLQTLGIPARLILGFWAGWPSSDMHA